MLPTVCPGVPALTPARRTSGRRFTPPWTANAGADKLPPARADEDPAAAGTCQASSSARPVMSRCPTEPAYKCFATTAAITEAKS